MRIALILTMLCLAVAPVVAQPETVAAQQGRPRDGKKDRQGRLQPGDAAPEFALKDMAGKATLSLAQQRGRPVVLYFGSCT
jgi:cytochrome oxidase Cu insertion factor (SCO1/SenC/PrrC family)